MRFICKRFEDGDYGVLDTDDYSILKYSIAQLVTENKVNLIDGFDFNEVSGKYIIDILEPKEFCLKSRNSYRLDTKSVNIVNKVTLVTDYIEILETVGDKFIYEFILRSKFNYKLKSIHKIESTEPIKFFIYDYKGKKYCVYNFDEELDWGIRVALLTRDSFKIITEFKYGADITDFIVVPTNNKRYNYYITLNNSSFRYGIIHDKKLNKFITILAEDIYNRLEFTKYILYGDFSNRKLLTSMNIERIRCTRFKKVLYLEPIYSKKYIKEEFSSKYTGAKIVIYDNEKPKIKPYSKITGKFITT